MSRAAVERTTPGAAPDVLPFVLPLVKIDAATGRFLAKAAIEVPDEARECCDYASSKPFFEKLAKRCLEESGGRKVAPLREMHQLIAAGNVEAFHYDDAAREIACEGVITNAESLRKALDGTLCGVSMGGKKQLLGPDPQHVGTRRYTAIPNEISLVDLGAIPGTALTMLNAAGVVCEVTETDGTVRLVKSYAEGLPDGEAPASLAHLVDTADHHTRHALKHADSAVETVGKIADVMAAVSPEAGAALANVRGKRGEMKKAARTDEVTAADKKHAEKEYGDVEYADPENKKYPLSDEKKVRAAWSYINMPKNAAKYADKGRAVKRKIIAAWKAKIDKAGPPSATDGEAKKAAFATTLQKAFDAPLAKNWGFYIAGRLAEILGALWELSEQQKIEEAKEGDAEAESLCQRLDTAISALGDVAVAMLAEEVGEVPEYDDNGDLVEEPAGEAAEVEGMANAADAMRGLKARMQRMHNMAVEMGAACTPLADCNKATEPITTAATPAAEEDGMTPENIAELAKAVGGALDLETRLAKAIGDVIEPLKKELAEVKAELAKQPEIPQGVVRAMTKAQDNGTDLGGVAMRDDALKAWANSDPVACAKWLMKQPGNALRIDPANGVTPLAIG